MALSDNLNGKTEQQLIDDGDFINALVGKLKAGAGDHGVYTKTAADTAFAKVDGANLDDAKVTAILEKLTDKVVKTSELPAKVADKAVVDAITASSDFTGNVYTKTAADTAFAKVDGANLDNAKVTAILEKLTDKVVKTSELPAKVAEQAVVDVLVPALATVGTDDTKKVYTKGIADTSFVKIDASNLTDAANQKAFAEVILPAKDGLKSILVEKLGGFLDAPETPYGAQENQAAKAFLAEKGLKLIPSEVATALITDAVSKKGLADEIVSSIDLQKDLAESPELQNGLKEKLIADQKFKTEIKTQANAQDAGFQKAVKAVMSQDDSKSTILSSSDPIFKGAVQDVISQEQSNFAIPQDSSSPLSWDW